jgi:GTPase SAR1 family protein
VNVHSIIDSGSTISQEELEEYIKRGGKTTVHHALGVVVGCGGAGKTTLLHRLMGKNDDEIKKIESTRGLEIHEHIFTVKNKELIGNEN